MSFYRKAKKQKDEKAFEDLLEKEKQKLYRIAFLYVKNETDALDIVQEAVYKAFINRDTLVKEEYFSTWITRILINTAFNFLKSKKKLVLSNEINRLNDTKNDGMDNRIDVLEAVKRLEEPFKTTIILRFYKDFTIKQIGETLECPEGTVKSHIHRALQKLKFDLGKEYAK